MRSRVFALVSLVLLTTGCDFSVPAGEQSALPNVLATGTLTPLSATAAATVLEDQTSVQLHAWAYQIEGRLRSGDTGEPPARDEMGRPEVPPPLTQTYTPFHVVGTPDLSAVLPPATYQGSLAFEVLPHDDAQAVISFAWHFADDSRLCGTVQVTSDGQLIGMQRILCPAGALHN